MTQRVLNKHEAWSLYILNARKGIKLIKVQNLSQLVVAYIKNVYRNCKSCV